MQPVAKIRIVARVIAGSWEAFTNDVADRIKPHDRAACLSYRAA